MSDFPIGWTNSIAVQHFGKELFNGRLHGFGQDHNTGQPAFCGQLPATTDTSSIPVIIYKPVWSFCKQSVSGVQDGSPNGQRLSLPRLKIHINRKSKGPRSCHGPLINTLPDPVGTDGCFGIKVLQRTVKIQQVSTDQ